MIQMVMNGVISKDVQVEIFLHRVPWFFNLRPSSHYLMVLAVEMETFNLAEKEEW